MFSLFCTWGDKNKRENQYIVQETSVAGMQGPHGGARGRLEREPPGGAREAAGVLPIHPPIYPDPLLHLCVVIGSPRSVSHTHHPEPPLPVHPPPLISHPSSHPTPSTTPLLLLASEKTTEWESMAQRPAWQDNKPQRRRGEFSSSSSSFSPDFF